VGQADVHGGLVIVMMSRGESDISTGVTAVDLGLSPAVSYTIRDLWTGGSTSYSRVIRAVVPARGATMLAVEAGRNDG
jgi:Alpha galactosidase C-terminal beta sandwich domain